MSEKLKESLSAAVDDEADEFETRRVLDEIARDDELRDKWDRYHLVRSVINGGVTSTSALERFWKALDAEDDPETADIVEFRRDERPMATVRKRSWAGRVTGLAVAATVALAVVYYVGQDEPAPAQIAVTAPGPVLWEIPSEGDRLRAQAYVLQHVRHTSMTNRAKPIPFSKLATYKRRDD